MKKAAAAILVLFILALAAALPAAAEDVFAYNEKKITLFEGEEADPLLRVEGIYAEGGEIVYSTSAPRVASVSEDGTVTALTAGKATISAALRQDGKTKRRAQIEVQVIRPVTKVTLSRKNLTVYEPDDPALDGLMTDATDYPVLVLIAGKTIQLNAVCTPENATNRKIEYSTTDVGIAKIQQERNLRAMEKGECDLVIASVQNPEVTETFHVLVIEPVKKITVEASTKSLPVGTSMQLFAAVSPETASIQDVTWSSRNPGIATVDENGIVSGIKKGTTTITATAADGTAVYGSISIQVVQDVTEITIKQTDVRVNVNRTVQLNATVLPKEADNRSVSWSSTDESIATVTRSGEVRGKKAGLCDIICTSNSNPSVTAYVQVQVVQPVRKITVQNAAGMTMPIGTSQQLFWSVEPEDSTVKDVSFKSSAPKIATVDRNGMVTGVSRGAATITVTAEDGSKVQATYRVNVTQPVEGVTISQGLYYVQRGRNTDIRATVLPKDANNQKVYWSIENQSIASIRSSGTSTGRVTGLRSGSTSVTATTDDGGFTASTSILVDDFDGAVSVENLWITDNNRIQMVFRNLSGYTIERVYFRVDCYDFYNQPLVVNTDGVSTYFDGTYMLELSPNGGRTQHGQFNFGQYMETGKVGCVVVTITGYRFNNGQKWTIPEEYRNPSQPAVSIYWNPYAAPVTVPNYEESENG